MYKTNLVFNNLSEIQIKLKILYFHSSFSEKKRLLVKNITPVMIKIFLKVLSLLCLKEVLSGKFRNRLVSNYLKKVHFEYTNLSIVENNVLFLDSTYLSTLAVGQIYTS
jgi:hypothetical protein